MNYIKEYILSLITISIAAGIINMIPPDGPLKKYIKYIISLSVAITLLLPLKDIVYTLPSLIKIKAGETDNESKYEIYRNAAVGNAVLEIEKKTAEAIKNKTGIEAEVRLKVDDTDPQLIIILGVTVILKKEDSVSGNGILIYVSDVMGIPYSDCEVEYK